MLKKIEVGKIYETYATFGVHYRKVIRIDKINETVYYFYADSYDEIKDWESPQEPVLTMPIISFKQMHQLEKQARRLEKLESL